MGGDNKLKVKYNSDTLYKIFIFLLILMYMLEATAWSTYKESLLHGLLQFTALGVALLCIVKRKYSIKELIRIITLNSVGVFCFVSSGFTGLFMTMLAITLLPKGALEKTLSFIFREEVCLFILIVFLSVIGVLDNKAMDINKGSYVANAFSLGFSHPNMLAAQGTSIVFLYLCLNKYKLKFRHLFLSTVGIIGIFIFSRGRTSLILGLFAIFMIGLSKTKLVCKYVTKWLPYVYIIINCIVAGSMIAYSKLGHDAPIIQFINDSLFNGRIGLAYRSLLVYPITLFGNAIDINLWDKYQYFSLDNGQVMLILEYGVIGFLAYFIVIQRTLRILKEEKEIILGIIMIVFLIWSMYEGTMYFIGKNFALLFWGTRNIIYNIKGSENK